MPLSFTMESCILYLQLNLNKEDSILQNNLLVAKSLTAKNWKSEVVPTLYDWRVRCQHMLFMSIVNTQNKDMLFISSKLDS